MIRKVLFLLFILASLNFGQSLKKYFRTIEKADHYAYNFQFDDAIKYADKAHQIDSTRPEYYQLLTKIYLWFYLGSKQEEDFEKFVSYGDSTIESAENHLDSSNEKKDLIYILGNINKYKAIVYGTKGNTLDAFLATKRSVSYYEDVIDIDSTYYSAYGGIGIFEYALSYVSSLFDWALTISGLSADKVNGFALIEKSFVKGKKDKEEYQFHLAKLYDEHFADYNKSISLLKDLLNEYPQNSLFHYQLAIEYIKTKQLSKSLKHIDKVLKINHPKFSQTNSFCYFLKGNIYFIQNDWEKATTNYQQFLESANEIDYTGIASLRKAIAHMFLDDELEFKKNLFMASNGNQDIDEDIYAHTHSDELLSNGFTVENKLLLKVRTANERADYKTAIKLISKSDSITNSKISNEIKFYKAEAFLNLREISNADSIFKELILSDSDLLQWITPYSNYYLALINFQKSNYLEAEKYLVEAEDTNNFFKKNLIQSLINNLKFKLEKKK